MFTAEQIQSLFGQTVIEYLQNKNRCGINGEKGSTYENSDALKIRRLVKNANLTTFAEIQDFLL
jgi:hypothetical protein